MWRSKLASATLSRWLLEGIWRIKLVVVPKS